MLPRDDVQTSLARLVSVVEVAYAIGLARDPSLPEMTEVLSVAFPKMSRDELLTRLACLVNEEMSA